MHVAVGGACRRVGRSCVRHAQPKRRERRRAEQGEWALDLSSTLDDLDATSDAIAADVDTIRADYHVLFRGLLEILGRQSEARQTSKLDFLTFRLDFNDFYYVQGHDGDGELSRSGAQL